MIGNPYYQMLGLLSDNRTGTLQLAFATLENAEQERFQVEGRRAAIAGRAKGLVIDELDEGGIFLCAGNSSGWFLLCRLEEL